MPEEIRKLLEKHPPETKFFKDRAELGALLSREKSRLVYSEVRGDARLLRLGKTPVPPSVCEPGYSGAVETLRRLAELCERENDERYFL